MQETFAGIRVVKSFAREDYKEKSFRRSNQIQFSNAMRMIKSTEAVGPLVETVAAIGVGLALLYVYTTNLSAGLFFGLITGIFILYDPIKTLSKIHIVMQRSVQATTEVFHIMDLEPTVQDAPNAIALGPSQGRLEFDRVTFRYATGTSDAINNINLDRWSRSAHAYAKIVARTDWSGHAGYVFVSRYDFQQYPVRTARCNERGSICCGADRVRA